MRLLVLGVTDRRVPRVHRRSQRQDRCRSHPPRNAHANPAPSTLARFAHVATNRARQRGVNSVSNPATAMGSRPKPHLWEASSS
jgi:hypothetical protein